MALYKNNISKLTIIAEAGVNHNGKISKNC